MRRFHLIFGIVVLIVFILTGQYMDRYHDHLRGMPDLPRMLYRSRHIYLLLAGLLHVGIGSYFQTRLHGWRNIMQIAGSLLITLATMFLIAAFFYEPLHPGYVTPFSRWGIYSIVAGTLFHLLSQYDSRSSSAPGQDGNRQAH